MDGPVATTVETPLGRLVIVVSPAGVMATSFDDDDLDVELERIERRLDAPIARDGGIVFVLMFQSAPRSEERGDWP